MSLSRNSLRGFLVHAKSTLQNAISKSERVTLVIGNESCDLDSLTSSVLYAYYRSLCPPATAFSKVYVPLINIPFRDLRLRPEFSLLFPYANIEASHLITLDDLPGPAKLKAENTRWILVDHNDIQGDLRAPYSSRVGGVIDHHDEENAVPKLTDPEPRIIEKCGSCTSLVTAYCREAWKANYSGAKISSIPDQKQGDEALDDAAAATKYNAQVAQLGLASILVDTTNLTSAGKTTEKDREAIIYLESKIKMDPQAGQKYNRDEFFKKLQDAKQSIGDLRLSDILRKDYKQWTEGDGKLKLGISSVVKPMNFLIGKAMEEEASGNTSTSKIPLPEIIRKFAEERDLSVYAIMTTSKSLENEFQRELFLWTKDQDVAHKLEEFEKEAMQDLGLESLDNSILGSEDKNSWRNIWRQKDVSKSRKQVAPLLRKYLNG